MFFITFQKLILFSRKSKFRILDIHISWRHQIPKHKKNQKTILGNNFGSEHSLLVKFGRIVILPKKNFYQKILQNLGPEN